MGKIDRSRLERDNAKRERERLIRETDQRWPWLVSDRAPLLRVTIQWEDSWIVLDTPLIQQCHLHQCAVRSMIFCILKLRPEVSVKTPLVKVSVAHTFYTYILVRFYRFMIHNFRLRFSI